MWESYAISKQRGGISEESIEYFYSVLLLLEAYDHALNRCGAGEGRLMNSYCVRKDNTGYYTKQPIGENF